MQTSVLRHSNSSFPPNMFHFGLVTFLSCSSNMDVYVNHAPPLARVLPTNTALHGCRKLMGFSRVWMRSVAIKIPTNCRHLSSSVYQFDLFLLYLPTYLVTYLSTCFIVFLGDPAIFCSSRLAY